MRLKLITAPAIEPVTAAEAKTFCRIDTADDDALIALLITAARERVEADLGRAGVRREALITQTWELYLDEFPGAFASDVSERPLASAAKIELPVVPVQSVTSVKYYDAAGVLQTVAGADYMVDAIAKPGRLAPIDTKSWPSSRGRYNDVIVRFVAGYGNAATDVPANARAAMRVVIADLYERRDITAELTPGARRRYDALLGRGVVFA